MSEGWVYIFSNPGLPKVVKVGYTLKHLRARAKELSHSGAPRPYVMGFMYQNPQYDKMAEARRKQHVSDVEEYR